MITTNTKILGIIGHPIAHSISPVIHNAAITKAEEDFVYLGFDIVDVKSAIMGMRAFGVKGLSVTIPYKVAVIPQLDSIDDSVILAGSCNTIINDNNRLVGFNTDGIGAVNALLENVPKDKLNRINSLCVIGYGGSARAVATSIIDELKINILYVIGRNKEKMSHFTDFIADKFPDVDIKYSVWETANAKDYIGDADLIVNTTPIGMYPNIKDSPINTKHINKKSVVFDIVYNPLKTKFLEGAEKQGAKVIDGLTMLINQASVQFEIFTGKKPDVKLMRKSAIESLNNNNH